MVIAIFQQKIRDCEIVPW